MCSGCGPVYAPVCACEAHPSRARQVSVCSSVCPSLFACVSPKMSLQPVCQPWCLSRFLSMFISESLRLCLSHPLQSCIPSSQPG